MDSLNFTDVASAVLFISQEISSANLSSRREQGKEIPGHIQGLIHFVLATLLSFPISLHNGERIPSIITHFVFQTHVMHAKLGIKKPESVLKMNRMTTLSLSLSVSILIFTLPNSSSWPMSGVPVRPQGCPVSQTSPIITALTTPTVASSSTS